MAACSRLEIFGELHFQDDKISSNGNGSSNIDYHTNPYRHSSSSSSSFPSMTSDSLSLCTEGLGTESFGEVEDLLDNVCSSTSWKSSVRNLHNEVRRSTADREDFPPPISCIGRNGKPWVWFKACRKDGRFILKTIRIPTKEFLHAVRENGRLKLHSIHSNDDYDDSILQEGAEEEECTNEDSQNWSNDNEDGQERNLV